MYDVIIIGAGPSGIFSGISASKNNKKVLLIEKNDHIGKKMKLTGGGRCNIINLKETKDFIKNLPVKNGRFLYSCLTNYNSFDIYKFFEDLGVLLKVEEDNKVFPKSNKSVDLIVALENELLRHKVDIKYNTEVIDIIIENKFKIVKTNNEIYKVKNIVIATGGISYPHTGSTGDGHLLARKFNHTITELFPTETPIISHDEIITSKELQGLSFTNAKLSLIDENKKIVKSHQNDFIFTHFGLSGPAALKLSQFVYHYLKDNNYATILVDVMPDISYEDIIFNLKVKREQYGNKNIKNVLNDLIPKRYLSFLLKQLQIDEDIKMSYLSNKNITDLVNHIKTLKIKVHDVKPIKNAFVTGGGVSLKEINPKTLESKHIPGLYFVGEVLDLHGYTGGYNMTIAITTGYTAGLSIE